MPANAPRGSSTASRGSARRGSARLVMGLPLRASVGHGGCPDKRDGTTPPDDSRRLAPAPTAPGLRAFQRHFVPLLRRRLLGPSYGVVPAPHRPHETRRRGDRAPWRARVVVARVGHAVARTSGTGQARPLRRCSRTPSAAKTRRRGDRAPWRARCGRRCWTCRPPGRAGRDKPVPYGVVPRTSSAAGNKPGPTVLRHRAVRAPRFHRSSRESG